MKFNKKSYQASRKVIIDMIKKRHAWESNEGFIADGVICPDEYEKQEIRILVILAESYGYSDSGMIDIEDQPRKDILGLRSSSVQTPKKVAALLWLFFKSLETGKAVEWDEFPWLFRSNNFNYTQLQEVLTRIAWINIKKASRAIDEAISTSTNLEYMEIYESGKRNKEILELQINSIAPDLILVFSNPVIHSLYDYGVLGEGLDRSKKYVVQTSSQRQKIIYMNHPRYLKDWGYEGTYETFQILYDHFGRR